MQITDDIYNDLLKRIEAGEFLVNTPVHSLPDLPNDADEETKKYRDNCQSTLELYLAKLKAMSGQIASMRKILDEKGATERANLLVKDFDTMLEKQFEEYKLSSEESITHLKKDLQQMKDQAANVIEQNRELKKENLRLVNKANKLHIENKKQEEKMQELKKGMSREITDMPLSDNKEADEQIAKKDSEIEKLRKAVRKKDEDMVKMARNSIEYCIADLVDIDKLQYEQKETALATAQNILIKLVKHGYGKFIDKGEIADMIIAITDIGEKRDSAKKQRISETLMETRSKEERMIKNEEERTKAIKEASTVALTPRSITVQGPYNETVQSQTIQQHPLSKNLPKGGEV